MTHSKTKCTAVTAKGQPCKALAIHNSNPPRCAPHSGLVGAPEGNRNAVTHGFYQRRVTPEERDSLFDTAAGVTLTEEAALLRVLLHRLSDYMLDRELPLEKIKSIGSLIVSTTRALAYLQDRLPDPNAVDWDAVLDELAEDLDWDI
jgi:hypothetical protein